jgi:hypothetical protein
MQEFRTIGGWMNLFGSGFRFTNNMKDCRRRAKKIRVRSSPCWNAGETIVPSADRLTNVFHNGPEPVVPEGLCHQAGGRAEALRYLSALIARQYSAWPG